MSKQFVFETPFEAPAKIDTTGNVLRGIQIAKMGEARGHDLEIDATTLDQIVALGNADPKGIKSRFGHPSLCSPGIGTGLGRVKNFRRMGNAVYGDLIFSEAAPAEAKRHIIAASKDDPGLIGSSIVFSMAKDAPKTKPVAGKKPLRLVRLDSLNAVDVVDDPAATDGLFSEAPEGIALEARTMADLKAALSNPEFVTHAMGVLSRQARVLGLESDKSEGERARILKFLAKCRPIHFEPEQDMPRGFAFHAIENEIAFEDALEGLYDRNVRHAELAALESASTSITVGAVEGGEGEGEGTRFGSLETSFYTRFVKLGYNEEEARRMAVDAAKE